MRVCFYTLGCKVNLNETGALEQMFRSAGFTIVPEGEEADVFVVNSCTVTNFGDQKSRKWLRRAKRENPGEMCIRDRDKIPPGSIREPLRQQLFHRRKLFYGEAQSLIFLGVGVRAARQMEVLHLSTEAGHRLFQRPEQSRIGCLLYTSRSRSSSAPRGPARRTFPAAP